MAKRTKAAPEVWTVTYDLCMLQGSVNHLSLPIYFGSEEETKAYMVKHKLCEDFPLPRYQAVKLERYVEGG